MTILKPTRVPSDAFTWNGNLGTCEISDLGRDFRFGQVYDDACDEGVTVVSSKTGEEVVFAITGRDMDHSGEDIAGWRLQGVTPGYKTMQLLIIND